MEQHEREKSGQPQCLRKRVHGGASLQADARQQESHRCCRGRQSQRTETSHRSPLFKIHDLSVSADLSRRDDSPKDRSFWLGTLLLLLLGMTQVAMCVDVLLRCAVVVLCCCFLNEGLSQGAVCKIACL